VGFLKVENSQKPFSILIPADLILKNITLHLNDPYKFIVADVAAVLDQSNPIVVSVVIQFQLLVVVATKDTFVEVIGPPTEVGCQFKVRLLGLLWLVGFF